MTFDLRKDIRQYVKFWLVFFFMVCIALACLPFLPETIATHWNGVWRVDSWGTKWTLLTLPLVDIAILFILDWIFTGLSAKFTFGSRIASDPKSLLYHCWLLVSLFFCVLEMLMIAQGFHTTAGGPPFLSFTLFGAILLLVAAWNKKENKVSWSLECAGFLLMIASIFLY